MNITYLEYLKYIKFVFSEELERMDEFLYSVDNNYDCSEDKYYVAYPMSNCPPDKDQVEKALQGRDKNKDFTIMDSESDDMQEVRENLYLELRDLMLG